MKITEIFYSIQGEGSHAGKAAIFIRLSGCNLRCKWCDTKRSWTGGKNMSIKAILEAIKGFRAKTIVLTGGEPFAQNIYPLIKSLKKLKYRIHVETNGTFEVNEETISMIDWIVVSPKGGGEIKTFFNELKYIVDDKFKIGNIDLDEMFPTSLQPEGNDPKMIKKSIDLVKKYPQLSLSLQLQRLINIK